MSMTASFFSSAIVVIGSIVGVSLLQDTKKPEGAGGMEMTGLQPTPGHAHLKAREGVWDTTVKMMMPGMPPSESKGTETNTMLAGLWLVSDLKGDIMGMPFLGHSIIGYDPATKKYICVWVDSMSATFSNGEGTCDAAGKVLSTTWEGPDPMGARMKWRQTDELKDPDTRVATIYMPGPDGKEAQHMVINYKRKK